MVHIKYYNFTLKYYLPNINCIFLSLKKIILVVVMNRRRDYRGETENEL